jgi:hypothetical protein
VGIDQNEMEVSVSMLVGTCVDFILPLICVVIKTIVVINIFYSAEDFG